MNIKTRDFGELEINEEDIITFVQPIIGFDEYSKYVFLYEENMPKQFARLQCVDEPELCFILADSFIVKNDYNYKISKDMIKNLGEGEYDAWLVTVITDEINNSTVNLKSPVLVNPKTKSAIQAVLDEDFPIRYPLFKKERSN